MVTTGGGQDIILLFWKFVKKKKKIKPVSSCPLFCEHFVINK